MNNFHISDEFYIDHKILGLTKNKRYMVINVEEDKVYCINDASGLKGINFRGPGRIFLLQGHQSAADPGNTLYSALNDRFRLKHGADFSRLKLWVFDRGSEPAQRTERAAPHPNDVGTGI